MQGGPRGRNPSRDSIGGPILCRRRVAPVCNRWAQASEKLLAEVIKRVPTQWYNGYGEYVASMYKDMPRTLY